MGDPGVTQQSLYDYCVVSGSGALQAYAQKLFDLGVTSRSLLRDNIESQLIKSGIDPIPAADIVNSFRDKFQKGNVGIFWDYQSVRMDNGRSSDTLFAISAVRDRLGVFGPIKTLNLYLPQGVLHDRHEVSLIDAGAQIITLPRITKRGEKVSYADKPIIVDALCFAFQTENPVVCIVSQDSDFAPLLSKLNMMGARSIIVSTDDANARIVYGAASINLKWPSSFTAQLGSGYDAILAAFANHNRQRQNRNGGSNNNNANAQRSLTVPRPRRYRSQRHDSSPPSYQHKKRDGDHEPTPTTNVSNNNDTKSFTTTDTRRGQGSRGGSRGRKTTTSPSKTNGRGRGRGGKEEPSSNNNDDDDDNNNQPDIDVQSPHGRTTTRMPTSSESRSLRNRRFSSSKSSSDFNRSESIEEEANKRFIKLRTDQPSWNQPKEDVNPLAKFGISFVPLISRFSHNSPANSPSPSFEENTNNNNNNNNNNNGANRTTADQQEESGDDDEEDYEEEEEEEEDDDDDETLPSYGGEISRLNDVDQLLQCLTDLHGLTGSGEISRAQLAVEVSDKLPGGFDFEGLLARAEAAGLIHLGGSGNTAWVAKAHPTFSEALRTDFSHTDANTKISPSLSPQVAPTATTDSKNTNNNKDDDHKLTPLPPAASTTKENTSSSARKLKRSLAHSPSPFSSSKTNYMSFRLNKNFSGSKYILDFPEDRLPKGVGAQSLEDHLQPEKFQVRVFGPFESAQAAVEFQKKWFSKMPFVPRFFAECPYTSSV